MEQVRRHASVVVEGREGAWKVRVDDDGKVSEQEFGDADAAEDYAASQRLLLGIKPQQDMA